MSSMNDLVTRTHEHLQKVVQYPDTKLDVKLLELATASISTSLTPPQRSLLVNSIAQLLQNAQQDPEPATKLAETLVEPFSFEDVQNIQPPVSLIDGLKSPAQSVQLLALRLIALASQKASDVAIVAGDLELVRTLVDVWLRSNSIAVAERAGNVLSSLLLADTAPASMPGLMQQRLFQDKDVYELFYAITSLNTVGQDGQPSKKDKTIAQGRLFSFLSEVWHLEDVWRSQIHEVEKAFGLKAEQGLIHFASLHMVDKDDILLRRTQTDFYSGLIQSTDPVLWARRAGKTSDKTLERNLAAAKVIDFLHTYNIHQGLVSLYTEPESHDPIDASFLHSPASNYVAEYLLYYREHFMSDTSAKTKIYNRLLKAIGDTPGSQWARNDGPSDDLNVLISIPFPALAADPSCLLLLPTKPPSADVFRCLKVLFSGTNPARTPQEMTFPPVEEEEEEASLRDKDNAEADAWASRQLYIRYTAAQPRFWYNLVAASGTTALKDTAIAAINLMTAIIRANWQRKKPASVSDQASSSPSDEESSYPDSGLAAVLHPTVLDLVVPFLMKGPSEGRGGAAGLLGADTESAEYHVAQAKLQMTRALKEGIEGIVTGASSGAPGMDEPDRALLTELAAGLGILLRQGTGRRDNEPGTEIGTMEL